MDEQQCDAVQTLIEESKTTDEKSENLAVPAPEAQLETQSEAKTEASQHNETKLTLQNHQNSNVQLIICPFCKNQVTTITKLKPGLISYLCCCAMVCLLIPCCCIPFMCKPCLNTSHVCPKCKKEVYCSGLLPM